MSCSHPSPSSMCGRTTPGTLCSHSGLSSCSLVSILHLLQFPGVEDLYWKSDGSWCISHLSQPLCCRNLHWVGGSSHLVVPISSTHNTCSIGKICVGQSVKNSVPQIPYTSHATVLRFCLGSGSGKVAKTGRYGSTRQ